MDDMLILAPPHRLCKGSQEFVHIIAQRMVSIARLFFINNRTRFAFIHKDANIAFQFGQGQGAFQHGESLGTIALRLVGQCLHQQDVERACPGAFALRRLAQACKQGVDQRVGDFQPGQVRCSNSCK